MRRAPRTPRPFAGEPRPPAAVAVLASPVGPVHAAAVADGIVGLEVRSTDEGFVAGLRRRTGREVIRSGPDAEPAARGHLERLEEILATRFGGRSPGPPLRPGPAADELGELPLVLEGVSDWDRRVLAGVRTIGPGEVAGYGEVARRIGAPGAARAVGSAVGRNPIGLLIPCHRVIAGDGTLGGYGGSWPGDREDLLALKEQLLALEGVHVPRRAPRD